MTRTYSKTEARYGNAESKAKKFEIFDVMRLPRATEGLARTRRSWDEF